MMRLGFSRLIRNPNPRCHKSAGTPCPTQQLGRSVSHFAAILDEIRDNDEWSKPTDSRTTRKKAYDPSSPEAKFSRHVLRSIFRECTHLPDSFAADYIRRHARSRFRTNEYKAWKNRRQFESQDSTRRKEARRAISTLQRANQGQRSSMLKVLNTAYGRVGKRRHEFIKPLLKTEGQDELLGSITEQSKDATATTRLTPTTPLDLTPQMRALLRSQIRAKPPSVRTTLRSIEPNIPELNSWLRPMPQNRIRNARKKHYAMLLDRVQAPLPDIEWERLRDLALGQITVVGWSQKRRRSIPSATDDDTVHTIDEESSALELVTRYGRILPQALPDDTQRAIGTGQRDGRWMQRLYAEVFSQCPLMEWDQAHEKWKVTWGFQTLALPHPPNPATRSGQDHDVPTLTLSSMEGAG